MQGFSLCIDKHRYILKKKHSYIHIIVFNLGDPIYEWHIIDFTSVTKHL